MASHEQQQENNIDEEVGLLRAMAMEDATEIRKLKEELDILANEKNRDRRTIIELTNNIDALQDEMTVISQRNFTDQVQAKTAARDQHEGQIVSLTEEKYLLITQSELDMETIRSLQHSSEVALFERDQLATALDTTTSDRDEAVIEVELLTAHSDVLRKSNEQLAARVAELEDLVLFYEHEDHAQFFARHSKREIQAGKLLGGSSSPAGIGEDGLSDGFSPQRKQLIHTPQKQQQPSHHPPRSAPAESGSLHPRSTPGGVGVYQPAYLSQQYTKEQISLGFQKPSSSSEEYALPSSSSLVPQKVAASVPQGRTFIQKADRVNRRWTEEEQEASVADNKETDRRKKKAHDDADDDGKVSERSSGSHHHHAGSSTSADKVHRGRDGDDEETVKIVDTLSGKKVQLPPTDSSHAFTSSMGCSRPPGHHRHSTCHEASPNTSKTMMRDDLDGSDVLAGGNLSYSREEEIGGLRILSDFTGGGAEGDLGEDQQFYLLNSPGSTSTEASANGGAGEGGGGSDSVGVSLPKNPAPAGGGGAGGGPFATVRQMKKKLHQQQKDDADERRLESPPTGATTTGGGSGGPRSTTTTTADPLMTNRPSTCPLTVEAIYGEKGGNDAMDKLYLVKFNTVEAEQWTSAQFIDANCGALKAWNRMKAGRDQVM